MPIPLDISPPLGKFCPPFVKFCHPLGKVCPPLGAHRYISFSVEDNTYLQCVQPSTLYLIIKTKKMVETRKRRSLRMPLTLFEELEEVWKEARLFSFVWTALAACLAYLALFPLPSFPLLSRLSSIANTSSTAKDIMNRGVSTRPHLLPHEITLIQRNLLHAETIFQIPHYRNVSLRHFPSVKHDGNVQPPDLFFKGIIFGFPLQSLNNLQYRRHLLINELRAGIEDDRLGLALRKLLAELDVQPTSFIDLQHSSPSSSSSSTSSFSSSSSSSSRFRDIGLGVYYSFKDLEAGGRISSDRLEPWKRIAASVKQVAASLDVPYFLQWAPHHFGDIKKTPASSLKDKNDWRFSPSSEYHAVVLQTIVPVRTGYQALRSQHVVWLAAGDSSPENSLRDMSQVHPDAWRRRPAGKT